MDGQQTIQREVTIEGAGIHTGLKARVRLKPAPPDAGIQFVRVDLAGRPAIPARVEHLVDAERSPRRTSLAAHGAMVQTVEHLLSALAAFRIDNVLVEIDNEELPGLDGSAKPYVELVRSAGVAAQDRPRRYLEITQPIWLDDRSATLAVFPHPELKISYTLSYDHPLLRAQFVELALDLERFSEEIAPARTFCLENEAEGLLAQGMGKGANYDNTVVVGARGVVKGTLRFPDEMIRHKVLDLIGDLYIAGPVKGHVVAVKSGHPMNMRLLQALEKGARHHFKKVPGTISAPLDVEAIQQILPHRYPFLLVDRIVELEPDKRVVGIKNVTINEPFFQGHFPGRPVMPGVLILEAMAQVAGVLILSKPEHAGKIAYFMSIEEAKFRKVVVPGDQLRIEITVIRLKSKVCVMTGQASVEGKAAAEATMSFSVSGPA